MLTVEQLEQYRRSGFVNGGPVLDDAAVEALQREVLRVIEERELSRYCAAGAGGEPIE